MSSIIHLPTEQSLSAGLTAIQNKITGWVNRIAAFFPGVNNVQSVETELHDTLRDINEALTGKGVACAVDYEHIRSQITSIQTGINFETVTKTINSESSSISFNVDINTDNVFGVTMRRVSVTEGGVTYGTRSANMFPPATTSGYMYGAGLYRTTSGTSTQSVVYSNTQPQNYPAVFVISSSRIIITNAKNDAPFVPGTYELTCYFNPPETRSLQRSVAVVEELTREEQEGDTR